MQIKLYFLFSQANLRLMTITNILFHEYVLIAFHNTVNKMSCDSSGNVENKSMD